MDKVSLFSYFLNCQMETSPCLSVQVYKLFAEAWLFFLPCIPLAIGQEHLQFY